MVDPFPLFEECTIPSTSCISRIFIFLLLFTVEIFVKYYTHMLTGYLLGDSWMMLASLMVEEFHEF